MPRLLKQILYGTFFLAIFAGIIWSFYSRFFELPPTCTDGRRNQGEQGIDCGGPCAKLCVPTNIQPLAISGVPLIFHSTKTGISILVEIQNPNSGYAAESFTYQFTMYGSDDVVLGEVDGASYVYGDEIKYVGVFNLPFPDVRSVEVSLDDPHWVPAGSFKKPELRVQNKDTLVTPSGVQVNGRFVNNDSITLPEVTVFALFYSSLGRIAGISKTELLNVPPGEVQEFSVIHPLFLNPDLSRTAVFVYGKRPVLP